MPLFGTAVAARPRPPAGQPTLLNPSLYAIMCTRFPGVHVFNRGAVLEGYYAVDPTPRRAGEAPRRRLHITRWGEAYLADCPYCKDTRGRLSVSYWYGVLDDQTGYRGDELWRCYNEDCQRQAAHRRDLAARLSIRDWNGPPLRLSPIQMTTPGDLPAVDFPGQLVPLDQLPDHAASTYLVGRGFDPADLTRTWEVGVAVHVPPRSRGSASQGRIVLPVRVDRIMVGWQARFPADIDWKAHGLAKYLTFFPKSRTLYGLDQAAGVPAADPWVLVEGATKVWRYGPGAVSGLGKGLSAEQVRVLALRIGAHPLVLAPDYNDPQSEPKFFEAGAALRAAGYAGPIAVMPLPPGVGGPDDLTTADFRARAAAALAAAR